MSICAKPLRIPLVAGVANDELEKLDAARAKLGKPPLVRVDCRDLDDIGMTQTPEETEKYGNYFARKAREYDDALKQAGNDRDAVVIHCHAGLHRSVSVAIVWCVWRDVCATTGSAQAALFKVRGEYADALPGYASAIDRALEILFSSF